MPADLTDAEQRLLQHAVDIARDEVAPRAATWERERRIGHEALAAEAVALGLTRLQVPVQPRRAGPVSFRCKARVAEVLAAGDFGFACRGSTPHNVAALLARQGLGRQWPRGMWTN
jgi:alkylation response protein AidB-like acyl-CoA dehydrogenase